MEENDLIFLTAQFDFNLYDFSTNINTATELTRELGKEIETTNGFAKTLADTFKGLSGLKTPADWLRLGYKVTEKGVTNAAEWQENSILVDGYYGSQGWRAQLVTDLASSRYGMSRREAEQYASRLGRTLNNADVDEADRPDVLRGYLQLANDLASKYGDDTDKVFESLCLALEGNTQALATYGINLSAPNGSLSQADKTMSYYDQIIAQTVDVRGSYESSAESFAKSVDRLEGHFDDFLTKFGGILLPSLQTIVDGVNGFIEGRNGLNKTIDEINEAGNSEIREIQNDAIARENVISVLEDIYATRIVDDDTGTWRISDDDIGVWNAGWKTLQKGLPGADGFKSEQNVDFEGLRAYSKKNAEEAVGNVEQGMSETAQSEIDLWRDTLATLKLQREAMRNDPGFLPILQELANMTGYFPEDDPTRDLTIGDAGDVVAHAGSIGDEAVLGLRQKVLDEWYDYAERNGGRTLEWYDQEIAKLEAEIARAEAVIPSDDSDSRPDTASDVDLQLDPEPIDRNVQSVNDATDAFKGLQDVLTTPVPDGDNAFVEAGAMLNSVASDQNTDIQDLLAQYAAAEEAGNTLVQSLSETRDTAQEIYAQMIDDAGETAWKIADAFDMAREARANGLATAHGVASGLAEGAAAIAAQVAAIQGQLAGLGASAGSAISRAGVLSADLLEASPTSNSNADGLSYVPYNDYLSYLHKGEAVLTAAQADDWRAGRTGVELSADAIASAVSGAVARALSGLTVQMDGQTVGHLVAPTVSSDIVEGMITTRHYAVAW